MRLQLVIAAEGHPPYLCNGQTESGKLEIVNHFLSKQNEHIQIRICSFHFYHIKVQIHAAAAEKIGKSASLVS